jgi:hypothetical protein
MRSVGNDEEVSPPFLDDALEERRVAEEPCRLVVRGRSEDLFGPSLLQELAPDEDGQPVSQVRGLFPVVRDEDGGLAGGVEDAVRTARRGTGYRARG